ncbi:MAG: 16S rRNA (cytidine(1402)-2'-O)-methyltransferase [Bacteroidetes bacterium]|jgi:16S rRNA (cytidine1402-2'-O)-methyltransferase|nr:16S rRNA (cytidine(1402)-2'-O)-methyltransferase [Bacteroidota bacterium]
MPKLYVVPTPIGNLEDITLRALRILKEVDVILSEDTRTSGRLLRHYDISSKLMAYHKFNEHKNLSKYIEMLKQGSQVALISDAGTPAISDPGFLLVRECIREGVEVECLPGATALIPALVSSGLPNDRFVFEGFLPHKKGRQKRLLALKDEERTIVLFESSHRLVKAIHELTEYLGMERQAAIAKELSKMHESVWRGTLEELSRHVINQVVKGEFVIIVAGRE